MKQRCRALIAPELEDLNNIHDPKERRKVQNRLSQRKHRKRQKEQLQKLQALLVAMDSNNPWMEQYQGQPLPNCQLASPTAGSIPRVNTPVMEPAMLESEEPSLSFPSHTVAPFIPRCGPSLCDQINWLHEVSMKQEPTGYLPNISPSDETEYSPGSEDSAQFGMDTFYDEFNPFSQEQSPLDVSLANVSEKTKCESEMDTPSDSEDRGVLVLDMKRSILAVCPTFLAEGGAACARHWCETVMASVTDVPTRRFVAVE